MKTIFITSYHGLISRNVLNTNVLKILRRQDDLKIVLLVPSNKKEFITKYYGADNVIVEGVDLDNFIEANKFWYRLSFLLQNTRYVRDQRKEYLWKNRNLIGYFNYWWLSFWAMILSYLPFVKKVYRWADFRFSPKDAFSEFFDKYNPSLVFATDIFGQADLLLVREAKYRGVRVIGTVRSWDNTTTKGLLRIFPEKIIVSSPTVKRELVKLHGYKQENILVVGLPQFDAWLSGPTQTREEFFAQIGADPNKRLILFAPAGSILSDTDWQLCQILKDALDDGSLPADLQFLIRNHPQHPADLSKFNPDSRFIIETPGARNMGWIDKMMELKPEENDHLRNSIYYSDIIMYVATSLGLDASVYNKPQILVSFDGYEQKPYIKSVRRYNKEDCLNKLVKCGGTRVVNNKDEWIKAINDYLTDPTLDQKGRDRVVDEHLYKIDGMAGERIVDEILKNLLY